MPPTPIPVGTDLKQRLAALRRRLRFVATFRGAAWLAAAVLFVLLGGGVLDWTLHLPALVRGVILTGLLTGAGIIVYRMLVKPLSEPTDDLSLALRVEERFPSLNDALASTMQFLERGDAGSPQGESQSLRRETVRRAVGRSNGLDFLRVVDARGLRLAGICAMFAVLPVLVLLLLAPVVTATAFARLMMPFSSIDWPRKTSIELDDVPKRIGRNREYRVNGVVKGVIPKEAMLELTHEGFPSQRRPITITPDEETPQNKGSFVMHLRPNEVHRNFKFRITANDATTPEYSVEVRALPVLTPLDGKASPQVRLDVPAYTDLPTPQNLPAGTGNVDAVVGTVVTLRAAADRPLVRAWVEYQPETSGATQVAFLAPLGATNALGVVSSIHLGQTVYQPVEGTLEADQKRFTIVFRPVMHGSYTLHFEDDTHLANQRQYELRLKPDPAPTVRMDRPSSLRDMLSTVLATAELPLHVVAEDTQYAVRFAWLEYRVNNEPARQRILYDYRKGIAEEAIGLTGPGVLIAPVPRLRLQRLVFNSTFSLRSIRHANGSPLKEGDAIVLQAFADDFDDVTVNKEPGRGPSVEIRIVARQEFENRVNQEQAAIQQELQRLHDKQKDAIKKVAEAEARMRKGGKMVPEREAQAAEEAAKKAREEAVEEEAKAENATDAADKKDHKEKAKELRKKAEEEEKKAAELRKQAQQIAEAEEAQQQINRKIGDDKEGLRAEVDRLKQTLKQNGMENTGSMDRLKTIGKELDRLAEQEMAQIEQKLQSAKKAEEMQDEQARKERTAELEQKAKQAKEEAAAEEERAKKLEAQAARLNDEAAKAGDEAEAAKKQADARNAEKQADQAKKRAKEKLAEAEQAKKEAAQPVDPLKARKDLAAARIGQEEVEKSLGELLRDMEPWSKTEEARAEASRLKKEQQELEAKLEELEQKGVTGKKPEELAPEEKAELEDLKDRQKRLADRADKLIEKMEKMAKDRADKDFETAKELQEAAKDARDGKLAENMKEAQEKIAQNKLNEAKQKQREAMAELEKLEKNLEKNREVELERLAKKAREAEKKAEELMDEQERLQKKVREAQEIKDKDKREQELKKLAKKQRELQERAQEELKKLSKLRNGRAQQAMEQAVKEMAQAAKDLEDGKGDDAKQDEVLDRLDEAREEAQKARKEAEAELGREQIARVADVVRRIRDRQQALVDESKRIQEEVQARKKWERGLKASTLSLRDNQKGLGDETASVAKKDLTSAPVFQRLLQQVARNMERGGERFRELVRDEPAPDKLPDAEADRHQKMALRGLQQLLDSLKEQAENPQPLARPKDADKGDGEDENGGGGGGCDNSLPPSAQLKLLRLMQKEVNDRTEEFHKKNPDPAKLTDKQKAELLEVQKDQKEVADLLDQLTRQPGEGMDGDVEKDEKEGDKK